MLDDFLFRYRFLIGGILIAVILVGSGVLIWDKVKQNKTAAENSQIVEIQKQNDLLRAQLSQNSEPQVAGVVTENESDKININIADASELDKLPGIGPAKAADIISYRDSNDGFQSIEDLTNVKGIGDKTFENLKDLITVGE